MNDNEIIVAEATENVEITTEETTEAPTPRTFTQEEVDDIVRRRLARQEARFKKDQERKYGELEEVLRAGTGETDVKGMTSKFRKFYQDKGITIPEKPTYSAKDLETLARADADEIIKAGYDELVDEVDRLALIGAANMTPRERAVFTALAEHRQSAERQRELSKIGVTEDELSDPDFKAFSAKFNSKTPISEIYSIYRTTKPKKQHTTIGSVKNTDSADSGVKDFYSLEEIRRFTKADFDRNPALFKACEASLLDKRNKR